MNRETIQDLLRSNRSTRYEVAEGNIYEIKGKGNTLSLSLIKKSNKFPPWNILYPNTPYGGKARSARGA